MEGVDDNADVFRLEALSNVQRPGQALRITPRSAA
jgi:hypothetical protein